MLSVRYSLVILFCVLCGSSALKRSQVSSTSRRGVALESATDFLLDAKMQTQQMSDMTTEVGNLAEYVKAGGDKAR